MLNLNRAMILGNATRDAELRSTPNGRSVAGFAVATNRRWTDADGEKKEEVQYHEIVAWGKLAEIAGQIIKRGGKVYVEGRLQTRNWEGQDGAKREKTEIIAENIIALSSRAEGAEPYTPVSESASKPPEPKSETVGVPTESVGKKPKESAEKDDEINLDDIPF